MLEVFVCCAPAERPIAQAIADRFSRNAELSVSIDDGACHDLPDRWDAGVGSAAILLVLSAASVPPDVDRSRWAPLLEHVEGNSKPPVASLLAEHCRYPRLLERSRFFRWVKSPAHVLRALERWAMRLHKIPAQPWFVPAQQPWFEGRAPELDTLWLSLVDRSGCAAVVHAAPGAGKSSLAQEFARDAAAHFRDVAWISCGGRSCRSIAADLAAWGGAHCVWSEDDGAAIACLAGESRVLVVLDDYPSDVPIPAAAGRVSVLVTSRNLVAGAPVKTVRLESAPEFPLAEPPADPGAVALWRAAAACRHGDVPFDLAARIAGLDREQASTFCRDLVRARLVDPLDAARTRLRVNAPSAASAAAVSLRPEMDRHSAALLHMLRDNEFPVAWSPELPRALAHAISSDWARACELGRRGFAFLRGAGRDHEAEALLRALRDAADAREDWSVSDECAWELSWIRGTPYRGAPRPTGGNQIQFDFGD